MNKNNILLIVILILTIVLVIYGNFVFFKFKRDTFAVYSRENSDDENEDEETNEDQLERDSNLGCKFLPWGPSLESCASNCLNIKKKGLWDFDGQQCNEEICRQICGLCANENRCQWIAEWSQSERNKLLPKNEEETTLSKLVPKKLNISGIVFPDTEFSKSYDGISNIKLFWDNDGSTRSFMIHYYNMKRSDNMIKVEYIDDESKSEHIIENIDKNSRYSVIMYAINEYGISRSSNIVVVDT